MKLKYIVYKNILSCLQNLFNVNTMWCRSVENNSILFLFELLLSSLITSLCRCFSPFIIKTLDLLHDSKSFYFMLSIKRVCFYIADEINHLTSAEFQRHLLTDRATKLELILAGTDASNI